METSARAPDFAASAAAPSSVAFGRALLIFAAAFPLVCWPGLEHPFSQPKFLVLALAVPTVLLFSFSRLRIGWASMTQSVRIALLAWLFATSASAAFGRFVSGEPLLLPLLGAGWLLLLMTFRPRTADLAWALVAGGGVVSVLALLEFARFDPFAWFGWSPLLPANPRMRVYATLGNPDFVAAFLAGLLPVTFAIHQQSSRRWVPRILLALQAAALCATGSRAVLVALLGLLFCTVLLRNKRTALFLGMAILAAAVVLAALPGARPLATTIRGRLYIWQVAVPRALDHPILGLGPGAFAAAYPAWEAARWSSGRATPQQNLFAASQQHAHNDFVEILLEGGALGLAAWLALVSAILFRPWRLARGKLSVPAALTDGTLALAAAGGIIALLSISFVDFPFHRPTEQFLFWSLAALAILGGSRSASSSGLISTHAASERKTIP